MTSSASCSTCHVATQTIPSREGSEVAFHTHVLHRPLLITCLVSPVVSLLNGVALYEYWKPVMVSQARYSQGDSLSSSIRVDPVYYVFVVAVFFHFVFGHVFVVQRGLRIVIGQRTAQSRDKESRGVLLLFSILSGALCAVHYVLYERSPLVPASPLLTSNAATTNDAENGFVRFVLYGTLLSAVVSVWYCWATLCAERLQRGVTRIADADAAQRRSLHVTRQHSLFPAAAGVGMTGTLNANDASRRRMANRLPRAISV